MKMMIKSIKFNSRKEYVYDIETPTHDYVLSNGIISHNTQELYSKPIVSGGCVIKGTLIKLSDGTLKAVEDIQKGEYVYTLDGSKEVTNIWNPDTLEFGTPECYEVEFEDGYKVTCSESHEFLIDGVWVEAKDLSIGYNAQII